MTIAEEGDWYYEHSAIDPITCRDGMQIKRIEAKPPWLVVDQAIESVILSKWPGELWRVRVQALGNMSSLIANPGYWRASAIELLEQMPLALLFGSHGAAVVKLLAQIQSLSLAQVEAMGATTNPDAEMAYWRAWKKWNALLAFPRSHFDGDKARFVPVASRSRHDKKHSPINEGFWLVSRVLDQRARDIEGDQAFTLEEEEDGDGGMVEVLAEKWKPVLLAFLHAAMALGAADYVTPDDQIILTHAWRKGFPDGLPE